MTIDDFKVICEYNGVKNITPEELQKRLRLIVMANTITIYLDPLDKNNKIEKIDTTTGLVAILQCHRGVTRRVCININDFTLLHFTCPDLVPDIKYNKTYVEEREDGINIKYNRMDKPVYDEEKKEMTTEYCWKQVEWEPVYGKTFEGNKPIQRIID